MRLEIESIFKITTPKKSIQSWWNLKNFRVEFLLSVVWTSKSAFFASQGALRVSLEPLEQMKAHFIRKKDVFSLSLRTVASSHSRAYDRYFLAVGSYRTWYLVGKAWHQRMPIVGVRRIHVQELPALWFVSSSVQLFCADVLRDGFVFNIVAYRT